jgi:hypothetical protein
MRPHAEDPDASVAAWAKSFVANNQDRTTDVLQRMLDTFRDSFKPEKSKAPLPVKPYVQSRVRAVTMLG